MAIILVGHQYRSSYQIAMLTTAMYRLYLVKWKNRTRYYPRWRGRTLRHCWTS